MSSINTAFNHFQRYSDSLTQVVDNAVSKNWPVESLLYVPLFEEEDVENTKNLTDALEKAADKVSLLIQKKLRAPSRGKDIKKKYNDVLNKTNEKLTNSKLKFCRAAFADLKNNPKYKRQENEGLAAYIARMKVMTSKLQEVFNDIDRIEASIAKHIIVWPKSKPEG